MNTVRTSAIALALLSIVSSACTERRMREDAAHTIREVPVSTAIGSAAVERAREVFGRDEEARARTIAPVLRYAALAGAVRSSGKTAVTLPTHAGGTVEIARDGMVMNVRPRGLSDTALHWGDRVAVHPEVAAGTDLLRRVTDNGVEDLYVVNAETDDLAFSYDVEVGTAAGLRLVAGALELLDTEGTPRLRVTTPIAFDAAGARRSGGLSVHGCAYDTRATSPNGRAVTAPGAKTCTVTARIDARGLQFPVLFDPAWESTAESAYTHYGHHAVLIPAGADAGKVLVAGGGGVFTAATELFDPATKTWALGASLPSGADVQDGSAIAVLATGRVVLTGGLPSAGTLPAVSGTFVRDEATGNWSTGAAMSVGRAYHASQVVTIGGKEVVVVAGGQPQAKLRSTTIPIVNYPPHATAETYDSVANTWSGIGTLKVTRTRMGSAKLADGRIVLVGGETLQGDPTPSEKQLDTTEYYAADLDGWLSGPRLGITRRAPTAVAYAPNKVMVAGGYGGTQTAHKTIELLDFAANTASTLAATMTLTRRDFPAVLLDDGRVILVGGDTSASLSSTPAPTSSVDVFVPGAATAVQAAAPMREPRVNHALTRLPNGNVLVTGGWTTGSNATQSRTAEIFDLMLGTACSATTPCPAGRFCTDGVCCATASCPAGETCNAPGREGVCVKAKGSACISGADCATGFCVDGVCCAEACTGSCRSCALPGTEGECVVAAKGTDPRTSCRSAGADATCAKKCDGTGKCESAYTTQGLHCGASLGDAGLPFCEAYTCGTSGTCAKAQNTCGLTCVTSSSCNEATKTCSATGTIRTGSCLIDGACYASSQTKPGDSCKLCDPMSRNTAWTNSLGCNAGPIAVDSGSDVGPDTKDATTAPDTAVADSDTPSNDGATMNDATDDGGSTVTDPSSLPEADACSCRVPGSTRSTSVPGLLAAGAVAMVIARARRRRTVAAAILASAAVGCSASAGRDASAQVSPDGGNGDASVTDAPGLTTFDVGATPDGATASETIGDAACIGKEVAAIKPPVDLIFVVDQSGSMSAEIIQVQSNINKLAAQLDKAYLDYHVVMIAGLEGSLPVCVPEPLGGANCRSNPPIFRASNQHVESTDALTRVLQTYDSLLPSLGWRDMLRPNAMKVFVPITDDNAKSPAAVPPATTSVAQQFDVELLKRSAIFGTAEKRLYRFYPICGASAADPNVVCGPGMVNTGSTYIELVKLAGGKNFPLCATDYGPMFIDMAKALAGDVACELTIPEPPAGETLDYGKVNVLHTPSGATSTAQLVPQDESKGCDMGANGWQYDAEKKKIILCGDACKKVQNDLGSKVNIQFGCRTRIN